MEDELEKKLSKLENEEYFEKSRLYEYLGADTHDYNFDDLDENTAYDSEYDY